MSEFKIGDRVEYRKQPDGPGDISLDGLSGTVVFIDRQTAGISVEFDEMIADAVVEERGGQKIGNVHFCRAENLRTLGVGTDAEQGEAPEDKPKKKRHRRTRAEIEAERAETAARTDPLSGETAARTDPLPGETAAERIGRRELPVWLL